MNIFFRVSTLFLCSLLLNVACTEDDENSLPSAPVLVFPLDKASNQELNVELSWLSSIDEEGDPIVYDVYLGVESNPLTVASEHQSGIKYSASNLISNTTYYWKIVAIDNSKGAVESLVWSFTTTDRPDITGTTGVLKDYDNNTYNWVGIGKQAWMAENLKVTHYPDGQVIPLVTDNNVWANLADNNTDDAYCFYNNDQNSEYGALYTYAAATNSTPYTTVDIQGVCPDGWHLPSNEEWYELEWFIRDNGPIDIQMVGAALKATSGWNDYNGESGNGTDKYNFSALAGGLRSCISGSFDFANYYGLWWSSSQQDISFAYNRHLSYDFDYMNGGYDDKSDGISVRCVKDR